PTRSPTNNTLPLIIAEGRVGLKTIDWSRNGAGFGGSTATVALVVATCPTGTLVLVATAVDVATVEPAGTALVARADTTHGGVADAGSGAGATAEPAGPDAAGGSVAGWTGRAAGAACTTGLRAIHCHA